MKTACDAHSAIARYPKYKKWGDDYFWLPHRGEPRGVGGIFYDHHDSGDWDADFAFTQDVGEAFLDIYPEHRPPQFRHRMDRGRAPRTGEVARPLCRIQSALRPRHHFGLKTGGNVESILSSMPPEVKWP